MSMESGKGDFFSLFIYNISVAIANDTHLNRRHI